MIRISTLIWLILSVISGSLLFSFSQKTEDQRHAIKLLDRRIAEERQNLNVLEAEWSYLNKPERLRSLSEKHLDLTPVKKMPRVDKNQIDVFATPVEDEDVESVETNHEAKGQFALEERLEAVKKPTPPIRQKPSVAEKSFGDVLKSLGE